MGSLLKLKIAKVIPETKDAISIHFRQSLFKKVKYQPGQFLTLMVKLDGKVERRCYSLNTAPGIDPSLSITVKKVNGGKVSNYLFQHAKKGAIITAMPPMGNFIYTPDDQKKRHLVFFGGGSGITPLMSIMKSALYNEPQSTASLIYCNKDAESIIFNKELEKLKREHQHRLNLLHVLENNADLAEAFKGKIEQNQVRYLLGTLPGYNDTKAEYFISGPGGMIEEVEKGLIKMNVPKDTINIERFSATPPDLEDATTSGSQDIAVVVRGKSYHVRVPQVAYILDAVLDEGIKVPHSCLEGVCGSCKARCLLGNVAMRKGHSLSETEVKEGFILPCISKALTSDVKLQFSE